jgi:dTDP-4-dehydrorhamnose 3,5-epimerase
VGEIFDVVVDIRKGSPRYGKWIGIELSAQNKSMVYIPPGFAHGACIVSQEAALLYMVTNEYAPASEAGIIWNDPTIAIKWPIKEPILSGRDSSWPVLAEADNNFVYIAS